MRLFILDDLKITKYSLPKNINETYLIHYQSDFSYIENTITIEVNSGQWQLVSNGSVDIIEKEIIKPIAILSYFQYYNLKINSTGKMVVVFCIPDIDSVTYNLSFNNLKNISIGSSNDCNICYANSLTNKNHANIVLENNNWYLVSDGLTYLNNRKVTKQILKLGDIIFIYGLKIIWMVKYIIINNPNNIVLIKDFSNYKSLINISEDIKPVSDEDMVKTLYSDDEYFYHTPRLKSVVIEQDVQIDAPPSRVNDDNTPAILTIGSSITMAASSLMTGYTVIYGLATGTKTLIASIPQIVICISLICGCLIIPRVSNYYKRRKKRERENLRQQKYKKYLDEKEEQIEYIMRQQKQILLENNLDGKECAEIILKNKDNIWLREIKDDDFLSIRLGLGSCPVKIHMQAPQKHFTLEEDNLYDLVIGVVNKTRKLDDIPISLSLIEKNVSALIFNCNFEQQFINNIITQIIALHSCVDLKIVIFTDYNHAYRWEYLKYLPHVLNEDKQMRFFATNMDEAKEVSSYLENEFKLRMDSIKNAGNDEYKDIKKSLGYKNYSPYYLIINDNYKLSKNLGIINLITKEEINCGFSLLILEKSIKNLPTSCETFVNVLDTESGIFEHELNNEQQKLFKAEYYDDLDMMQLAYKLSNIPVNITDEKLVLPKSISFLEMYGVSKIEQLNITSRWEQNNPVVNLAVPVGVHTNGEIFKLDLHEKYDGPHGLIAGSTGSGKSEFIITYILSMAINYRPDEVQFVLIDYKGGGLAGAFENKESNRKLPHLVGTITNLDTASMNRTLVSIESELKRRQKLFNKVRFNLGESTIDIYKYQKFYRDGLIDTPLSHLIIICDEFAELKTQQPDFMNQLISAARIGRSLGVHLVLATQKPMGIVNDQIWSNSKFRVCLKVQDRSDSIGVLKRPDAASIKDIGRFYLQVGYDDYFDIGQSAYSGARYVPSDKILKKIDNSINFINNYGSIYKSVDDQNAIYDNNLGDQLTNIINYIMDIASKNNYKTKQLWLDNIPQYIYLNDLKAKYSYESKPYCINPIIGEYDNPKEQKQGLFTLDISSRNTLIYGMTGSGKENLLRTLIYSVIINHSPSEINFYILDFGSEILKVFNDIAQVGDIALLEDGEKIVELINMLAKEMELRKELFSNFAGNYVNYVEQNEKKLPLITIIINNYEVFVENYPKLVDKIQILMRDGSKYGIVFVVTTSVTNGIRSRVQQCFSNKLCLQLSNDNDYRLLLNAPKKLLPMKYFGRGLTIINDEVFEFQTAYISLNNEINNTIINYKNESYSRYSNKARRIPVLPNIVAYDMVSKFNFGLDGIPIGFSLKTKDVYKYDFLNNKNSIILSDNLNDKIRFINALIRLISDLSLNIMIIDMVNLFKRFKESNKYYNKNFEVAFKNIANQLSNNSKSVYLFIGLGSYNDKLDKNCISILNNIIYNSDKYNNKTFIFIDSYNNFKNIYANRWLKNKLNTNSGIWLGQGINSQITFDIDNLTLEDKKLNFPYMGFAIINGYKNVIKCVIDDNGDNYE